MDRKTRFKQQRIYNLKIFLVSLFFVITVFSGLLTVDLNKSYIFYGKSQLELFQIEESEKDIYRVSILDMGFNINLKYIKKDYENVKNYFK